MEPKYTEWKPLVDGHNRRHIQYCPYCEDSFAIMMIRYCTDREGEVEKQFRVECPVCHHTGKTYLHESVAEQSWKTRENDPPPEKVYRRGRWV